MQHSTSRSAFSSSYVIVSCNCLTSKVENVFTEKNRAKAMDADLIAIMTHRFERFYAPYVGASVDDVESQEALRACMILMGCIRQLIKSSTFCNIDCKMSQFELQNAVVMCFCQSAARHFANAHSML